MPNTFGITAALCPLVDPRRARRDRIRFRQDEIPELTYANSFYCPSGVYPARGWLLVRRADYNKLNVYATNLQVQIDDTSNPPLTFSNLSIVQARCVSRGTAADPQAVYLVEVTDARGILWNQWFEYPTTSFYNIRSPAYPQNFYSQSMTGGVAWDWNGMVGDLWAQIGLLGAYPGLPVTPLTPVENWWFPGVGAWTSLCSILNHLGLTVTCNLAGTVPYSIVVDGAADGVYDLLTAKYAGRLQDDLEYIDAGSGRAPGLVIVLFHRRNQYYGTEETVRRDAFQWATTPYYSVTIAAPTPFNVCAGLHYIWSDFTVQYDVNGNPMAADVTIANLIAQERVNEYFNRITQGTSQFMKRVYAGVLPFTTGSRVDGVGWRQDFRTRSGWRTEVVRGMDPPWPLLKRDH